MIRYFGAQKKIFKIHFRNVSAPLPHFIETFMDDGYYDMYKIMKALRDVEYDGIVIPDHVPRMGPSRHRAAVTGQRDAPINGFNRAALAYSIAYMRALRDRAIGRLEPVWARGTPLATYRLRQAALPTSLIGRGPRRSQPIGCGKPRCLQA